VDLDWWFLVRIQWIGQSARAKSTNASDIRLVNAYAEVAEHKQSKSVITVYRTPGLRLLTTLTGAGPVRGLFYAASQDRLFAVQSNAVLEILNLPGFPAVLRGTVVSTAGPVQMDENGVHLAIVDVEARYHLTFANNAYATDLDVSYPKASRVGFIDNYFIYLTPGSQEFAWSDLLSTTVQPLNKARAEGRPDPLVSLVVLHRELWLFGTETTQPFYSTGDPDTPFAPVGSMFLHQGCAAPQSPARVGDSVCWLSRGQDGQGMVMQAAGQNLQRISTHAVEEALQRYAILNDALGWSYQIEGHLQYTLTFPAANATWVYDVTTQLWHELGTRDAATGFLNRHRANCYTFAFGLHMVGDYVGGQVYALDTATYSDAGQAQVVEIIGPPLFDGEGGSLIEQKWLLLELETGVGLDGGANPGADPQVWLQVSNDSGHTYEPALQRSLGPIGRTRHIVEWRALGSSWDRRCKLIISDPVKIAVTGLLTEVAPLMR
jgi:Phage stabilisation protein